MLMPAVEIPGRKRLQQVLEDRVQEVKKTFFSDLGKHTKVSLALDCWSSPTRHSFLAVMAHYISDDWVYREVLLGFKPLTGPHTGRNLAKVVEDVIVEFDLAGRLFSITADNASNNATLCRTLEQALHVRSVPWSADAMKVSCLAHVLHLSAQALLHGLRVADDLDRNDVEEEPNESSADLNPNLAENPVAATVVKVRV